MNTIQRIYIIDGIKYRENGWFGCQLTSVEWKAPRVSFDNKREILGYKLAPVNSLKGLLKWNIDWCLADVIHSDDIDFQNQLIQEFKNKLRNDI